MDPHERIEALVAPLRADTLSGAAEVARTAADIVGHAAEHTPAESLDELRSILAEVVRRVLDAQPSMAPLVTLARGVLSSVESASSVADGRVAAARAAAAFRSSLEERAEAVAATAAGRLPAGARVATVSSSSTVRAALLRAAGSVGSVVCFEGRPMREGRSLAARLAREGIDVTYAVDAATQSLVAGCDALIVGADSIGDLGVVNKIGTASAALAASRASVPVYVLADETKILPSRFPQTVEDERPGAEVWERAPGGVTVWNRYFEVVPAEAITAVVTENGVLSLEELERMREALELPDALRRWAEGD